MIYEVQFSPTAEAEILAAAMYIAKDSPLNAERWYEGIHVAIMGLSEMPNRCAFAREADAFGMPVRQLVFKSYRVIFSVEQSTVRVHRVIHTSRQSLDSPDELT